MMCWFVCVGIGMCITFYDMIYKCVKILILQCILAHACRYTGTPSIMAG